MTVVSDSFDRANSTNLGSDWTEDAGTWEIASNAVRQTSATGLYRKLRWIGTALAGANNYVESPVTFGTLTAVGAGVAVRMATSSTVTFYALIGFPGDQFYIIEITAGAEAILDSGGTCNTSTTYTMRVEVDGSNIRGLVNGVEVVSISDASLSSGAVGLITYGGDSTLAPTFASFAAGDLGITGTASLTLAALSTSAAGAVAIAGAANLTLAALTISAAGGSGAISGAADLTLGALAPTGAGAVAIAGQSSLSLDALTISAAGGVGAISGTADLSLGALAISAAGALALSGAANLTLGALTITAAGGAANTGQADLTLGALTSAGYALRFYGNGSGNIDRVWLPLESGGVRTPIDVGDDFTYEFWLTANYADNTALVTDGDNRYRNAILDRDIWGDARGWTIAMARDGADLVVSFAVAGSGLTWTTITGSADIGDGSPHHIAVTRRRSDGRVEIYVDGALDASGTLYNGSLQHTIGQDDSPITGADYQLVIGAEKHDAGAEFPSGNFVMDELRISDVRRYTTNFTPAASRFTPDANTAGLYHFENGSGTALADSATVSGAPTNGTLLVGGSPSGPAWVTGEARPGMTGALAITGQASLSLTALTIGAAGIVAIVGQADLSLGALTTNAAGAVAIAGQASLSLTALTIGAAGGTGSFGAADLSLTALTIGAAGTMAIAGQADLSLGALTTNAAGAVAIAGQASLSLDALTISAAGAGAGAISGAADLSLGALAPSGAGSLAIVGQASLSISALTLTSTGILSITGSANLNLGSLTLEQLVLVTVARSISGPGRAGTIQSARTGSIQSGG